jgi:hypothetical protein
MRMLSSISVLALCGSSLLAGCETKNCKTSDGKDGICAESLKAFEGDPQTLTADYVDGASVTIHGVYGDIAVIAGDPGLVSASFQPFDYRGHSEQDAANHELDENLDLQASADSAGDVSVTASRHDSKNGLGSHITVALPPEFNGSLVVKNDGDGPINQGHIDVSFVGDSTTLSVLNHGLENCNILRNDDKDPAPVTLLSDVDVVCEADITVRGVNDNVLVQSRDADFHSNVNVELGSVAPGAVGGKVIADNGSAQLILPLGASFSVSASATGAGAHVGKLEAPDSCTQTRDDASLELACGDDIGPHYTVTASDGDESDRDTSFVNVLVQ